MMGLQSRCTGKGRQKMTQLIPKDERPLPAFARLKAAVRDGLIDFSSADTGHRASFCYRKPFALNLTISLFIIILPKPLAGLRARTEDERTGGAFATDN